MPRASQYTSGNALVLEMFSSCNAFEMEHLILFMLTIVHQRSSSYHVFKFNGSISSPSSSSPSYATLSSKVVVELPEQMVLCTSSQQARLPDYLKLQAWQIWKCENVRIDNRPIYTILGRDGRPWFNPVFWHYPKLVQVKVWIFSWMIGVLYTYMISIISTVK